MTDNPEATIPPYSTVTLEKIRIGAEVVLSREVLMDARVDAEQLSDMIVYRVRGSLLGETWPEREAARYPADWWQAFRARWFPRWTLRRWPVRYTIVKVRADVLYPEKRVALPSERYVVPIYHWRGLDDHK